MAESNSSAITLAELFKANDVPDDVLDELARAPFLCTTVKHFALYFDDKTEIKTMWAANSEKYKTAGNVIANLKYAWREATNLVETSLKRTAEGLPDENLDDPLRSEVEMSLKAAFLKTYGFNPPPPWMGVPSLVGRLHREFMKRSHIAPRVNKIKTLGQLNDVGPALKRQRIAADLELVMGASPGTLAVHHTFSYIQLLQSLLYSMTLAGSFKVTYHGNAKEAFMVPLQPCLTHLSNAQCFVGKWASKSFEHDILRKLTEIDETIRNRWAEIFRASDEPLGVAIDEADNLAQMLWQTDVPLMQKSQGDRARWGSGKGSGSGKKENRKLGSASFIEKVKKGSGKNQSAKSSEPCKFWNKGDCTRGKQCGFSHVCNFMKDNGKICGRKDHKAINHK